MIFTKVFTCVNRLLYFICLSDIFYFLQHSSNYSRIPFTLITMSKSSAISQKKELIEQLKLDFIKFDKFRIWES